MRRVGTLISGLAFLLLLAGPGAAQAAEKENGKGKSLDPAGVERLRQNTGGKARVSISTATGAVRFVGIEPGERGDLMGSVSAPARDKASAFIREYAGIFGLRGVGSADCRSVPKRTTLSADATLATRRPTAACPSSPACCARTSTATVS